MTVAFLPQAQTVLISVSESLSSMRRCAPGKKRVRKSVLVVHKLSELVYLLRRKELGLVGDYYIVPADLMIFINDILLRRDDLRVSLQPDAAADDIRAVAGVCTGLDEPDRHAQLFIVESGYNRLGRF